MHWSSTKTKLLVDTMIFLGFLWVSSPLLGGIAIHEWLSTALIAGFLTHLLLNFDWIVNVTRRFFRQLFHTSRLSYMVDLALLFFMTVAYVSGFAISREVFPTLGLPTSPDRFWRIVHEVSADFTLVLVGVHTALHWDWIVTVVRRYLWQPVAGLPRKTRGLPDKAPEV